MKKNALFHKKRQFFFVISAFGVLWALLEAVTAWAEHQELPEAQFLCFYRLPVQSQRIVQFVVIRHFVLFLLHFLLTSPHSPNFGLQSISRCVFSFRPTADSAPWLLLPPVAPGNDLHKAWGQAALTLTGNMSSLSDKMLTLDTEAVGKNLGGSI